MKSFKYVLLALLIAGNIQMAQSISKKIQPRQKLSYVESIISEMYVDKVDEDKLVEDAIRGMLEELDPHSTYSTREETLETQEVMQGSFSGIGIQFNMQKDTLYVIQTIAGGPSEKVGILPGDRFIAVDDTVIAGKKMKNTAIMKMLRGKKGTKVDVTVVRRGTAEPLQFRITRDDIPVNSIDAVYMADDKTGYIRLSRFGMTTFTEFEEALKRLKAQGMKQLILDLSDNGGGYMNIAAEIANEMLGKKQLIVYTQGNHSRRHQSVYCADRTDRPLSGGPLHFLHFPGRVRSVYRSAVSVIFPAFLARRRRKSRLAAPAAADGRSMAHRNHKLPVSVQER